jgi:hypothetical protein
MIEFMNFHTNVYVKAMRFTTLFRKTVHAKILKNINTGVLIMVVGIKILT